MTEPHDPPLQKAGRAQRLAWGVLAVCLAVTLFAWNGSQDATDAYARARFDARVVEVSQAITQRLRAYEQVLRGGAALFQASGQVSRQEWQAYYRQLRLSEHFPGIQGFGFTVALRPDQVDDLEARLQAEGFVGFRVWPEGERDAYSAIIYLEPFDWRNQRAFGFDMYSQPVRRQAMAAARDQGRAAMTGKVILVQETAESTQAGFLIYLPVYAREHTPDTLAERRASFLGWVYSPFRMADLMDGILGGRDEDLEIQIYDGEAPGPDNLLYRSPGAGESDSSRLSTTTTLEHAGRTWTLRVDPSPALEAELDDPRPELILAGGTVISLLLFAVVMALARIQSRAVILARRITSRLQASEARLSSLVEMALDAIIVTDLEGRVVAWNRGAEQMFGYRAEEMEGQALARVIPERFRAGATPGTTHPSLAGEQGRVGQVIAIEGLRRDGKEFPVELAISEWAVGGERYFSAIVRDVSERRRVEEALRLSEERFRIALRHTDITVFNQDRELRYTWIYNPPVGLADKVFLGRRDTELSATAELIELKRRVLDQGKGVHQEISVPYQGSLRHFDLSMEPTLEQGRVVGIAGTAIDITPIKRVQEELQRSEERFRATFQAAGIGIVLTDMDDRILAVNPAWERMLGYRQAELLRTDFLDYLDAGEGEEIRARNVERLAGRRPYVNRRLRYQHKNGDRVWGSLTVSLVYEQDRPTLAIRMIEDVTELRTAEEALRAAYRDLERRVEERTHALREQARELARSNEELEQFAYVASHDLQEPLRSVSGFAQLLERRHGAALGEEGREFLGFIVNGTARMRQLIVDLLAFSRVGASGARFRPVPLTEVLADALDNLNAGIEERGALVTHDPLPVIMGERGELLQLYQNLIGNALKFNDTPEPRVHVGARDAGDHWLLWVKDNGIGIDRADVQRIFTIFQRAHRTDDYPGTGVGLAICRKVVERHHGRIWVESQAGEGAAFYFTFPKADEAMAQPDALEPGAGDGEGRK